MVNSLPQTMPKVYTLHDVLATAQHVLVDNTDIVTSIVYVKENDELLVTGAAGFTYNVKNAFQPVVLDGPTLHVPISIPGVSPAKLTAVSVYMLRGLTHQDLQD